MDFFHSFLTSTQDRVNGQLRAAVTLPLGKDLLVSFKDKSVCVTDVVRTLDIQRIAKSLHRLCYPGCVQTVFNSLCVWELYITYILTWFWKHGHIPAVQPTLEEKQPQLRNLKPITLKTWVEKTETRTLLLCHTCDKPILPTNSDPETSSTVTRKTFKYRYKIHIPCP
jgi:hypothetical protein